MLNFPIHSPSTPAINNGAMWQMTAFSDKLRITSPQLHELNLQALRRFLMQESQADLQKAGRIRTFADAQRFFSEQSTSSIDKLTGYWQNVGNIALQTWGSARRSTGAVEAAAEPGESSTPINDATIETPTAINKPHEAGVQPSPLVEKLVASAAVDAAKPGSRRKQ